MNAPRYTRSERGPDPEKAACNDPLRVARCVHAGDRVEALLAAFAGILALGLAGAWDIGRRKIAATLNRPDPAEVEEFEVKKLLEVDGRLSVLERLLKAGLDSMAAELEDAKAERRSAAATKAAVKRWMDERDREDEPERPETPEVPAEEPVELDFESLDPERQVEALEGVLASQVASREH